MAHFSRSTAYLVWSACLISGAVVAACGADGTRAEPSAGDGSVKRADAGGRTDAGEALDFGNSKLDGAVVPNGTSGEGAGGSPQVCANVDVRASRVVPTVMLIIDQSSSMQSSFDGATSRWDALRGFLLSADGLIDDLQKQVRFGLALYSARALSGSTLPDGKCPLVTTVAPKLNNYAAIAATYEAATPIADTPTGDSIDEIVSQLDLATLDTNVEPVVFILATDGEPDRCEQLNPQEGQQESIDAVTRAFALGIRTFIISVGEEVSAQHQQDVANAGVGHEAGEPNAEYWTAGDDASLRTAISEIIGRQLSCKIALDGSVEGGDPCDGTIKLNGKALECNGPDGWKLVDDRHIRLRGQACTDLKTLPNAMLTVSFPCSVGVVF
jgi:von Willebrand factor type A domain